MKRSFIAAVVILAALCVARLFCGVTTDQVKFPDGTSMTSAASSFSNEYAYVEMNNRTQVIPGNSITKLLITNGAATVVGSKLIYNMTNSQFVVAANGHYNISFDYIGSSTNVSIAKFSTAFIYTNGASCARSARAIAAGLSVMDSSVQHPCVYLTNGAVVDFYLYTDDSASIATNSLTAGQLTKACCKYLGP